MTLLSITDTAALLNVSRRTVYHRIRDGYLQVETIMVKRWGNGGLQPSMRVRSDSTGLRIRGQKSTRWRAA
jgi:hypothetical protein